MSYLNNPERLELMQDRDGLLRHIEQLEAAVARAERERDEARAEAERMREALEKIAILDSRGTPTLTATEAFDVAYTLLHELNRAAALQEQPK